MQEITIIRLRFMVKSCNINGETMRKYIMKADKGVPLVRGICVIAVLCIILGIGILLCEPRGIPDVLGVILPIAGWVLALAAGLLWHFIDYGQGKTK